jgi:hypothetical protein
MAEAMLAWAISDRPSHLHDTAVQYASAGDAAIHVMPLDIRRKRGYSHNRLDEIDYKVERWYPRGRYRTRWLWR